MRSLTSDDIALVARVKRLEVRSWFMGLWLLVLSCVASAAIFVAAVLSLRPSGKAPGVSTQLVAQRLIIKDIKGVTRAQLGVHKDGLPFLTFYDGLRNLRMRFELGSDGKVEMLLYHQVDGHLVLLEPVLRPPEESGGDVIIVKPRTPTSTLGDTEG